MANRTVTAELEMKGRDSTGPAFKSVAARMGQMEKQFSRFNQTAAAFNARVSQIERTATAMNRVQKASTQMQAATESKASMFATSIKGLSVLAAGSVLKDAVVSFADMERHMTRIGITAEASKEEVTGATQEVKRLSMQLGYGSFEPAITALDTLVSSGMSLKEAMAFLPSVMATAQASGAATEDIANSGLKAASAFKIQAEDLQTAFDHMAYSGKLGQFELKDMSLYLPKLATSFATLGYEGQGGLDRLLAIMQVIRGRSGTAENAAANATDLFGKIYSPETINKFRKLGVDLNKELKKAKANGEDLMFAFARLTRETVHGDLSKLPQLFQNQEARLAITALIEDLQKAQDQVDALNSKQVKGTVLRDVNTVLGDTQTKLDRLSLSWDNFLKSVGAAASGPAGYLMDSVTGALTDGQAISLGLDRLGYSKVGKMAWLARHNGPQGDPYEINKAKYAGDPTNPDYQAARLADIYNEGRGRKYAAGSSAAGAGEAVDMINGIPVPTARPIDGTPRMMDDATKVFIEATIRREAQLNSYAVVPNSENPTTMSPNNPAAIMQSYWDAVDLEEKSQKAGNTFSDSAGSGLLDRAAEAGSAFGRAAADAFNGAIRGIQTTFISPPGNQGVNADVGRPGTVTGPAKFGRN